MRSVRVALVLGAIIALMAPGQAVIVWLPSDVLPEDGQTPPAAALSQHLSGVYVNVNATNQSEITAKVIELTAEVEDRVDEIMDPVLAATTLSATVRTAYEGASGKSAVGVRTNLTTPRNPALFGDAVVALHREFGDPLTATEEFAVRQNAATVPGNAAVAGLVLSYAAIDALDLYRSAVAGVDQAALAKVHGNESILLDVARRMEIVQSGGEANVTFSTAQEEILAAAATVADSINKTKLAMSADVVAQALDEVAGLTVPTNLLPAAEDVHDCTQADTPVVFESPDCLIVLGRSVNDAYGIMNFGGGGCDQNVIMLDFGGSDSYRHRAGGGVTDPNLLKPCKAIQLNVDLGTSNDVYNSEFVTSPGAAHGGGYQGVGALYDAGGSDQYLASMNCMTPGTCDTVSCCRPLYAQGGAFAGVGLLFDMGGNDLYRLTKRHELWPVHGQGAGQVAGIGILRDAAGQDTHQYNQTHTGRKNAGGTQGFASMAGIGYLIDLGSSADTYSAGSELAQGAASTGGVGILADLGGANTFSLKGGLGCVSLFTGGCTTLVGVSGSSWGYADTMGFGLLLVESSGSTFSLIPADASFQEQEGIHVLGVGHTGAVGIFMSRGGNDAYSARGGAIGYGDYAIRLQPLAPVVKGVGVFIDHSGIDSYDCAAATCIGAASNNALGLFLDSGSTGDAGLGSDLAWKHGDIGLGANV